MNVNDLLKKYSKDLDENKTSKLEIIKKMIAEKDYDTNFGNDESSNLTLLLIYEYATSIESITNGKVTYLEVVQKLTSILEKFRLGDWKSENDDEVVMYGTSNERFSVMDKRYLIQKDSFGAQGAFYINKENKFSEAIAIYDKNASKSGIDTNNLNDIRHTVFHEFTHIMELEKLLSKDETEVTINGRVFRNNEKKDNGEVWSTGLITREFGENSIKYNNGKAIIHNQITEGFVELIARKIMEQILGKEEAKQNIDMSRYETATQISQCIMDVYGEEDVITTFLTHSSDLIKMLESIQIDDRDALHYISDFINDQRYFQIIPKYSYRTQFFRINISKIIEELQIFNVEGIKEDWDNMEHSENPSEKISELLFKHSTKSSFSEEDIEKIDKLITQYRNLLRYEKEFKNSLEGNLRNGKSLDYAETSIDNTKTQINDENKEP